MHADPYIFILADYFIRNSNNSSISSQFDFRLVHKFNWLNAHIADKLNLDPAHNIWPLDKNKSRFFLVSVQWFLEFNDITCFHFFLHDLNLTGKILINFADCWSNSWGLILSLSTQYREDIPSGCIVNMLFIQIIKKFLNSFLNQTFQNLDFCRVKTSAY